MSHHPLLAVW